jgi:anti-repressor protein
MDYGNALRIFEFEGIEVRVVEKDGEPWWVAKDVCDVLGIQNVTQAIEALDSDEKLPYVLDRAGQKREVNIISESGLYTLIMRSNKPDAKRFRKWVTSEVLPSIRKHGGYLTERKIKEVLDDPDAMIRLFQNLKADREKIRALEAKESANRPKIVFAESVEASSSSILIGDLAKLIRQNNCEIGPNRLFEWLRQNGYLMKGGESRNMPTQRAMEAGWFQVKERTIDNPDGSILLKRTTKVTGCGQVYFINFFRNMFANFTKENAARENVQKSGQITIDAMTS